MAINIRSGGPAASQRRYREGVQSILVTIRRTETGRLVMDRLARAPFDVVVEPNLEADGFNNAFERAASHAHSGNARLGTSARGTRSLIAYSSRRLTGRGVQFAFDEALLHELCHSLRTVYGRRRLENSTGDFLPMAGGFENVEEFFAAMVTSVHSSELGRPALGNHGSWRLPSVDLLRKPPFDTRLRQFNVSMPEFCRDLRSISAAVAPFNPFRDIAAP